MSVVDSFDEEKWEQLRKRLEPFSKSRLKNLRRADRDPDDAINSAFRTFLDRLQNPSSRPEERRDPVPKDENEVLQLLFKHLWRKIKASYREEKTLKRSARRSSDGSAEAADVFFNQFVETGDLSDVDLELFFQAALKPISHLPEDMQELATLMLQSYTPREIGEKIGKSQGQVYPAIIRLRSRVENLE